MCGLVVIGYPPKKSLQLWEAEGLGGEQYFRIVRLGTLNNLREI
jgi:hypothetical protein